MTKRDLYEGIKRRLGAPMVRVELHETQIDDCINQARYEGITKAAGLATQEIFFTIALSAGVDAYDLPSGVKEVITVNEINTSMHGINTLFTIENYLYNKGALGFLNDMGGYSMLDYHLALDFIDTIDKYIPNRYVGKHEKLGNKLRLQPAPEVSATTNYLLLNASSLMGTDGTTTGPIPDEYFNIMWDEPGVQRYSLALAKQDLGMTRRKFANFTSIGNEGIALDGDSLVSEGKEEVDQLKEELTLVYSEALGEILMG